MIVLVVPMLSKRELNADSNYVVTSALIRAMRTVRPGWQFIYVWPDKGSGYRYEDDGFFALPNVTRLPMRIVTRKRTNAVTYRGDWYDRLMRRYAIDVCWCNLVEAAGHIRFAPKGLYMREQMPVSVAAHNYVIHPSLPYPWHSMENIALQQLHGAVLADANVFNSTWCRRMLFEVADRYLSAQAVARIQASSRDIPYGPLEPDLAADPDREPNDVPVIAYNHRLQRYKNYRDTFAVLRELWDEGLRFRLRYMSNVAENVARIRELPFGEVRLCATRADYLEALRGCDLNVTNSKYETFCISAVESMALGQPLVAPDGVTFPEITGRADNGYPFLFRSRDEQAHALRQLIGSATLRRRWGRIVSDHVRTSYRRKIWAQRYADLFESLGPEASTIKPDAKEMLRRMLLDLSGQELRAILGQIAGTPCNGRIPFGTDSMTPTRLARCARRMGFRVVMRGARQTVEAP